MGILRCATHSELWRKTYENQWQIYIDKFWMLPSSRSNFLHFHAVFGEIWPKNRLAPPSPLVSAFSPGKSLIHPWECIQHGTICAICTIKEPSTDHLGVRVCDNKSDADTLLKEHCPTYRGFNRRSECTDLHSCSCVCEELVCVSKSVSECYLCSRVTCFGIVQKNDLS